MQATREIYWNVGHGPGTLVPMYLLAGAVLLLLAAAFLRRSTVYRLGGPSGRFDRPGARILTFVRRSLGQTEVVRVPAPGVPHALFFWGFLLLFVGTLIVMVQADLATPLFDWYFWQGDFYRGYSLVLDVAGVVAIVTLLGLAVRRWVYRPPGLETRPSDFLAHGLLVLILVTGYLIEGARIAVTELADNPALARWSPVGSVVARALDGLSPVTLRSLHVSLWWYHLLLTIGFLGVIPFTKLRHMFTTSADYLFVPHAPRGTISTPDLEDEQAEQFGAHRVDDLAWKDVLDTDACMSCKRCQDRCPAWNTGKPLSPMRVIQQIGEVAFSRPAAELQAYVTAEVLWECTTCHACQTICPATIEHVNKILEMRRYLALMEGQFPGDEVRPAMDNYEVNGNPFGLPFVTRGDWAAGLDVSMIGPDGGDGNEVDLLYFVGCYASFDRRNQRVARSLVEVLAAAGLRVGVLGRDEVCCGEPPRKLGNEYLYQSLARRNIEAMHASGTAAVITTCPHCYNTLGRDYRDLGFTLPVEHYTTLLPRLVAQGLRLPGANGGPAGVAMCTVHDSCYLSRYQDIVAEPRAALAALGVPVTEMAHHGYDTFCCGGGGGLVLAEERVGRRINATRAAMAADTGAELLVTSCPFCLTMLEDGVKTAGLEDRLRVRDLLELTAERLPSQEAKP